MEMREKVILKHLCVHCAQDHVGKARRMKNPEKVVLKQVCVHCAQDHVGKSRRMKNPEKLAASTKKPLVARYIMGGRVILTRDPEYVPEYRDT